MENVKKPVSFHQICWGLTNLGIGKCFELSLWKLFPFAQLNNLYWLPEFAGPYLEIEFAYLNVTCSAH